MPKKIIYADQYGFCFGVKRAVEALKKNRGKAQTLGPVIHNPQVVEYFRKKGIYPINSIAQAKKGPLFIRAHGVAERIIEKARKKGLKVIDLTCPYVKKTQILAKKLEKDGYQVIILGMKNHPEVIAIAANLKQPLVAEKLADLKKLKKGKVGVICQTTANVKKAGLLLKQIKKKFPTHKIYNTICDATQARQKAAKKLAKKSDLVLVIGGKKSSNTRKLKEVAEKIAPTRQIETASELKKEWLKNKKTIGLTAGASTPDWVIKSVAEEIKKLAG